MSYIFGFIILILYRFDSVSSVSEQIESQSLYDYLFENYTSNLLPACRKGRPVTLRMDIALRQIIDLNEPEQILTTNVWMRLNWNDCRLTWDPVKFDNLTYLTVMYEDVWTPDITLYDSAASEDSMFPGRDQYRAYISSSGSVSYNFPTVMISICRVNVKYFPFDTQQCTLKFGSWSHHGFELDIISKNPKGDTDIFITNNEWIIEDFPAERNVLYYNCCPEPYPDITYYVILERRPAFYVMTMLFPCVLVTFVAGLAFMLPTESGEKVSLEITVLLSLSVFLLLVSEALPPSSDNFPIIGFDGIKNTLINVSRGHHVFSVHQIGYSMEEPEVVLILPLDALEPTKDFCIDKKREQNLVKFISRKGYYFATSMVLVTLSLVQTVLVVNLFHRGRNGREVPRWVRVLFSKILGRMLCAKRPTNRKRSFKYEQNGDVRKPDSIDGRVPHITTATELDLNQNNSMDRESDLNKITLKQNTDIKDESKTVQLLQQQVQSLKIIEDLSRQGLDDSINAEWHDISNITDRLFLIIYSLVSIITTLIFMIQMMS